MTMTTKHKYTIEASPRYRKELRKILKTGKKETDIDEVINTLAADIPLSPRHRDHQIYGKWVGLTGHSKKR